MFWERQRNGTERNGTKRNGTEQNETKRGRPRADILLVRSVAIVVINNRFIARLVMSRKNGLEKHLKLQTRSSDWEPARHILTSDVKN